MPDHKLIDGAEKLIEVIVRLPSTWKHLSEAEAGYPSVASGGDHDGGQQEVDEFGIVQPSTIVERLAVNSADGHDDEARAARTRLDKALKQIRDGINEAWGITATWHRAPTRPNHAKGDIPDDWCHSCYRDHQHHEPVTRQPSGVPYYVNLCRWCGGFKASEGRLPTLGELEARHSGRRVRIKDKAS